MLTEALQGQYEHRPGGKMSFGQRQSKLSSLHPANLDSRPAGAEPNYWDGSLKRLPQAAAGFVLDEFEHYDEGRVICHAT